MIDNKRFPHTCIITRTTNQDPMQDIDNEIVIYQGICRSYSKHTTSISGEVISSFRGLSLPQKQSEWTADNIPQEGDIIVVDKGSFKEYGVIEDRLPGNLGTHLLWKFTRN